MVKSIKQQFESIENRNMEGGIVLARAVLEPPPISAGAEYFEYVNRYGPPINGIFDESLLALVRKDLGIAIKPGMYTGESTAALVDNLSTTMIREALVT